MMLLPPTATVVPKLLYDGSGVVSFATSSMTRGLADEVDGSNADESAAVETRKHGRSCERRTRVQ
jgi:hypothetical protein